VRSGQGSVQRWLALPLQVKITSWVPSAVPLDCGVRHLLEFGLINVPLPCGVQFWAPVPLHVHSCTLWGFKTLHCGVDLGVRLLWVRTR
jgi:hypothetical protein